LIDWLIDVTLWVVSSLLLEPDSDTRTYTPVKGKGIPIEAWTDPHGPRKLRLQEFLRQSAHEGTVVIPTHQLVILKSLCTNAWCGRCS